jgi:tRNA/rRNA methyltransferase
MKICFILVEPAVPGNIGASARAIKTMGFSSLRLVRPCEHLGKEARMLAHGAGEILDQAEVYGSLGEALGDLSLSVATTSKKRGARVSYITNADLSGILSSKGSMVQSAGIVFGREEYGLSNDEIRRCDLVSTIPLKQPYPSLNLSQAVMLYAYSLADLGMSVKEAEPGGSGELTVAGSEKSDSPEAFRTMMDQSADMLRRLEVDRSPALYNRILERLALLGEDDVHLVLSVLSRIG